MPSRPPPRLPMPMCPSEIRSFAPAMRVYESAVLFKAALPAATTAPLCRNSLRLILLSEPSIGFSSGLKLLRTRRNLWSADVTTLSQALQESLAVLAVAKCFGAAGARRGEGSTHIAVFKAVLKACSTNEFVQKASVETVACPDGIDGLNGERSSMKAVFAAFGECALRTALDDNDRNEP